MNNHYLAENIHEVRTKKIKKHWRHCWSRATTDRPNTEHRRKEPDRKPRQHVVTG